MDLVRSALSSGLKFLEWLLCPVKLAARSLLPWPQASPSLGRTEASLSAGTLSKLGGLWSTKHAGIEYNDYFANHLLHGAVALHLLGAPEDQVESFSEVYFRTHLGPPSPGSKVQSVDEALSLRGKVSNFRGLRDFFEELIEKEGAEEVVRRFYPLLADGVGASAIHPLIHLGYSLQTGHSTLIAEGLAYLVYRSLRPAAAPQATPKAQDPFQLLLEAASQLRSQGFAEAVIQEQHFCEGKPYANRFQQRVAVAVEHPQLGRRLPELASLLCLPEGQEELEHFLLKLSIAVYALDEIVNDFYLLHGITSSWALLRILRLFPDGNLKESLVLKYIAGALLPAYVAQGCPKLGDVESLDLPTSLDFAEDARQRALSASASVDEHVIKLVQVVGEAVHRWPQDEVLLRVAKVAVTNVFSPFNF